LASRISSLLQAANSDHDGAETARQELISMLMDRHGTSRVLFRNTRNGVKGFPKRELHTIKLPLPTQYQTAIKVSGIMGRVKVQKTAPAICSTRNRFIRNSKAIAVPGGTSTHASNG
jgi:ATP-dependent helicase HepA